MQLIIRFPNWIGDAVMATPLLERLSDVAVVAKPHIQTLLEGHPSISHRFLPENVPESECGILLTNSFSSAWGFWKGGVRRRIGFTGDWRRLLLTDPLPFPKMRYREHLSVTYQALLRPLGLEPDMRAPRLYVRDEERGEARQLMGNGVIAGFHINAAFGPAKCWPKERYRLLATALMKEGIRCVFFGAPNEVDAIAPFVPEGAVLLAGKTSLRILMAALSLCTVVISNDSGPMHIADALGVPVVSLFGSTEPKYTGPFSNMKNVVQKKPACAPCFKRECPIDFRCMNAIEEHDVRKKTLDLIENLEQM